MALQRVKVLEEILREMPLEIPNHVDNAGLVRQASMPANLALRTANNVQYGARRPSCVQSLCQGDDPFTQEHLSQHCALPGSQASPLLRTGSPRAMSPLKTAPAHSSSAPTAVSPQRQPSANSTRGIVSRDHVQHAGDPGGISTATTYHRASHDTPTCPAEFWLCSTQPLEA